MQSVLVLENITFYNSLFTNRLILRKLLNCWNCWNCAISQFHSSYSNQHQPSLLFSSETWDTVLLLNSLLLLVFLVLVRSFVQFFRVQFLILSCSRRVSALVHTSIWSCHVIVRYNLFGLLAYSAEHRKSGFLFFFFFFRLANIRCIPIP